MVRDYGVEESNLLWLYRFVCRTINFGEDQPVKHSFGGLGSLWCTIAVTAILILITFLLGCVSYGSRNSVIVFMFVQAASMPTACDDIKLSVNYSNILQGLLGRA